MTAGAQRQILRSLVKTAYRGYLDVKVGDEDKLWAPHIIHIAIPVQ